MGARHLMSAAVGANALGAVAIGIRKLDQITRGKGDYSGHFCGWGHPFSLRSDLPARPAVRGKGEISRGRQLAGGQAVPRCHAGGDDPRKRTVYAQYRPRICHVVDISPSARTAPERPLQGDGLTVRKWRKRFVDPPTRELNPYPGVRMGFCYLGGGWRMRASIQASSSASRATDQSR